MSEELVYMALSDGPFDGPKSVRLVIQLSGGGVSELFYADMTDKQVIAALRRMADNLEKRIKTKSA